MEASKEKDLVSKATAAATKPLEREASKWRVSVKTLAAVLLFASIALALFWVIEGSSEQRNILRQQLVTISDANKITIDKLGRARSRMASKTDSTLYEFLADHHDTKALEEHSNTPNVVREILLVIEHDSVQLGIVLVVQLFSDLHAAWPRVALSDRGRKKIEEMIAELEQVAKLPPNELETGETDENAQPITKRTKVMERIRNEIKELKDLGEVDDEDKEVIEKVFGSDNPLSLASMLRTTIYIYDCRPYLAKIDTVRIEEMKGKPMDRMDLSKDGKKKEKGGATPAPTKQYIPTEANLLKATSVIEELEVFLNDKPELNKLIRDMLLKDLKDNP